MERGRPNEGEEVDESRAIREMAAAFPPGRHLLCEDGRAGRTKIRTDRGLAVHDSAIIPRGGGGATQVTAGCRVPSPKPRHLFRHQIPSRMSQQNARFWARAGFHLTFHKTTGDLGM